MSVNSKKKMWEFVPDYLSITTKSCFPMFGCGSGVQIRPEQEDLTGLGIDTLSVIDDVF